MPVIIVLGGVLLLLLLVMVFRLNALFALLIASMAVGAAQGMDPVAILSAMQEGIGSTLGQIALILAFGAMLGKLIADGGGARRITNGLMQLFGRKNLPWAMVLTGFIVGIPLFYNVGFVVLVPFAFMICASTGVHLLYVAIPLLAALSVTHGFLPPHPGATAVAVIYKADIGLTMIYGCMVSVPAIIISGPLFARTLSHLKPNPPESLFQVPVRADHELPGFVVSLFTALFPVLLIAFASVADLIFPSGSLWLPVVRFVGDPVVALLVAVLTAVYTMGMRQGKSIKEIMAQTEEAARGITMILFIIGASGAFKQVLVDSGIGDYIAEWAKGLSFSPLVLAWAIAALIRVSLGSATVAALTAAGIVLPVMASTQASPELMTLATGAGSLMFSHVNDPGFWMFKEYFGLNIRDTIRSWSLMETIISITGLAGVLLLNIFI